MDAVEYLKAKVRMTSRIDSAACTISCKDCPLSSSNNKAAISCKGFESRYPEKAVAIVEKWAKEYPIKTRLSEFLKMYPNAQLRPDGMLDFDLKPCYIDPKNCDKLCDKHAECEDCQHEYWNQEVE